MVTSFLDFYHFYWKLNQSNFNNSNVFLFLNRIEYTYDIFANEMRWVDEKKNVPTNTAQKLSSVASISTEKNTEASVEKNKQTTPPAEQSQRKQSVAAVVAAENAVVLAKTEGSSSKRAKVVPDSAPKEHNSKTVVSKERTKDAQKRSNDGDKSTTASHQTPQRSVILINAEPIAKKRGINKSQNHTFQKSQATHSNTRPTLSNLKINAGTSSETPLARQSSSIKRSMVVQKGMNSF